MKTVISLLLLVSLSAPVRVFALTGTDLLAWCEQTVEAEATLGGGFCLGAAYGVHLTMSTYQSILKDQDVTLVCFPEAHEPDQMRRIILNYLRTHPDQLQFEAYALVIWAFMDAFPCAAERES